MMFKNISLGIYYPGDSLLHRLQARTKLLLLAWFTVFLLIANNDMWHFVPYIVLIVLTLAGAVLSSVSLHQLWRRIRFLSILILIGSIPTLFTTDSSAKPIYTVAPFTVSFATVRWAIVAYGILLTGYIVLFLLPVPALRSFPQRRWFKRILSLLILLTLVVIFLLWLVRDIPLSNTFPIGPFVITDQGVWSLASFSAVLLLLYTLSLLLTMTTSPIALIEGLTVLLTPLRWLRLPVDDFALMTLIALRFIPTLIEEVEQLLKAQTSRGADFAHGTLRERVQSVTALFVPLLQGVLRRAADLATALEARGYEVDGKQTRLHEKRLGAIDYAVLGVVAVITVGSLVL
jgi:energy-coupling factor transport system permease protein